MIRCLIPEKNWWKRDLLYRKKRGIALFRAHFLDQENVCILCGMVILDPKEVRYLPPDTWNKFSSCEVTPAFIKVFNADKHHPITNDDRLGSFMYLAPTSDGSKSYLILFKCVDKRERYIEDDSFTWSIVVRRVIPKD